MKKSLTVFVVTVGIILLTFGCASVKFYSDPGLKNETGLRYYTLKPYFLVEYQAEKDNIVKTTVVYLPDLAAPQYMYIRPGLGSGEVKMNFKDGALESYGIVTDSKIPESLEAFAAMLSKSAYAAQAFTGPPLTVNDDSGTYFRLYEIIAGTGGTVLKEITPERKESQGARQ